MKKAILNILLAGSLCAVSLTALAAQEYNLDFMVYKSAGGQPYLINEVNTLIKADDNANPMVSSLNFKTQEQVKSYELKSYLGKGENQQYPYLFDFKSEKLTIRGAEKFNLSEKVLLKPNEITTIEKEPYTVKIKITPLTK